MDESKTLGVATLTLPPTSLSPGLSLLKTVLNRHSYTREEKNENLGINAIISHPPVSVTLTSVEIADPRLLKFWSLLLGGVAVFFSWLFLFSWCAKVWQPTVNFGNTLGTSAMGLIDTASDTKKSTISSVGLLCVDIWFALALMAAIDAFAIVINFNRPLIHQFHYFVSLRMMVLAFIISTAAYFLHSNKDSTHQQIYRLAAAILLGYTLYTVSVLVLDKLHKLLPVRGIGESRGSLQKFSEHMCLFDLPWKRAIMYATINGTVGFLLTSLVPAKWSILNPVVHITWEVTFLGLMGTKQTPRYIWFATPVVQASTCTDWGLRQVTAAPRLVIKPWGFLAFMLAGRLIFDIHLYTVFRHRRDFHWARKEALFPTNRLLAVFAAGLMIEFLGLPVVTLIKPLAVLFLHAFGALVFLLPASYGLAFDKIKFIRSA